MPRPIKITLIFLLFFGCPKNKPPDCPKIPSGPAAGEVKVSYPFFSAATDPDGDSVAIRFNYTKDDTTDWSSFVSSGTEVTITLSWSNPDTYLVRAQAKDKRGLKSNWSLAHQIVITKNKIPNTPAIPSGPEKGLVYNPYSFFSSANDPDGDSVAIRFDWGDGDTSNWSLFVSNDEVVVTYHIWTDTGTFLVKAQAKDKNEAISDWSQGQPITIERLKWRYQTDGGISTSPAISPQGMLYFGSADGYLYALNPDGRLNWRYQTGAGISSSPAIGPDGTIYFGSGDSFFYALNPDRQLRWRYKTGGCIRSSPAIGSDGTIYFGADDGYLYALNSDGRLEWRFSTGSLITSSPAIQEDGIIYFGSYDNYLYALNPDGQLRWRYRTEYYISTSPAIGPDGTVYFGSWDHFLYALNPDGTLKWRYPGGGYILSSPVVGPDGTIYFGANDGFIYALNPDRQLKWRYPTGNWVLSSPAVSSDSSIYFGSNDGYLYALNFSGQLRWRYKTDSPIASSPTIAPDGTIYFGSNDRFFYAIPGSGTLAVASWPKFRHDLSNTGRIGGPHPSFAVVLK